MDKFSNLPGPIADRCRSWEADAIEQCRNDPRVAAAGLCYVCMCPLPDCLCVRQRRRPPAPPRPPRTVVYASSWTGRDA